jgi:hypothetical protein
VPSHEFKLGATPVDADRREIWMKHAAGFILLEDVHGYALSRLDPNLSPSERRAAVTAIDETLYGLMMVLDGVTGALQDSERSIVTKTVIHLRGGDAVLAEVDASEGDGMCLGYHRWIEGDFGADPVAIRRT